MNPKNAGNPARECLDEIKAVFIYFVLNLIIKLKSFLFFFSTLSSMVAPTISSPKSPGKHANFFGISGRGL